MNNQSRENFFSSPFKSNVSNSGIQGWNNPQGQGQMNWKNSTNPSNRPPFVPLVERTIKLEDTLDKFIQASLANHQSNEAFQKNIEASIQNLETQVGQISKQLAELTTTPFSANTTTNPKEQCKSIVTSSGMEISKFFFFPFIYFSFPYFFIEKKSEAKRS